LATLDRPTILRIALEAQLDPRTVKRAFEHGIDSLQSDHSKARLRAALKKMKFEGLITPARRGRPPA
jgi:hypothetical protein